MINFITKNSNKLLVFLIISLLIIFFIVLHQFLIYYFSLSSSQRDVVILGKILPPLLGAFFSGIVAIFIFTITKFKEDFAKKKNSEMYFDIIKSEINKNITSLEVIKNILNTQDIDLLTPTFLTNAEFTQKFKLTSDEISLDVIDKFLVQLNKKDYLKIIPFYKKFSSLKKCLNFIVETNTPEEENLKIVLKRLKLLFDFFDSNNFDSKQKDTKKKNDFILWILLAFLVINILTSIFIAHKV